MFFIKDLFFSIQGKRTQRISTLSEEGKQLIEVTDYAKCGKHGESVLSERIATTAKQIPMKDLSLSRPYRKYHIEDFLLFYQKEKFLLYLQNSKQIKRLNHLFSPFILRSESF